MKTINIVGAGHVGKVLGQLFSRHGVFRIGQVLNRSAASTQAAIAFIGSGEAAAGYAQLRAADLCMLAVPDDQVEPSCAALAQAGCLRADTIVFHCSGALSSAVLAEAQTQSQLVAGLHPIRSFADPQQVARHFSGTFCGLEGQADAVAVLRQAVAGIDAKAIDIRTEHKTLYHAAAVFASNYSVTLIDLAQRAYVAAGIPQELAGELSAPLVMETMANVFRLGPEAALSGPIARGDMATVARQQQAVQEWDAPAGRLYAALAEATVELAARKSIKTKP